MSAKVVVLRGWGLGDWGLGDGEGAGANILVNFPIYYVQHAIPISLALKRNHVP